jgi:hypothetical protein
MHASRHALRAESPGPGYEARTARWGDYRAYFERIAAGTDFSPYYERCDCPHWGYVFTGKLRFAYADGSEEVVSAGEMYYVPPGHTFQVLEDAETVEFSPAAEYDRHLETVARNLDAAAGRER